MTYPFLFSEEVEAVTQRHARLSGSFGDHFGFLQKWWQHVYKQTQVGGYTQWVRCEGTLTWNPKHSVHYHTCPPCCVDRDISVSFPLQVSSCCHGMHRLGPEKDKAAEGQGLPPQKDSWDLAKPTGTDSLGCLRKAAKRAGSAASKHRVSLHDSPCWVSNFIQKRSAKERQN